MKMTFPHLKTTSGSRSDGVALIRPGTGIMLLMLFFLQAGFSSFTSTGTQMPVASLNTGYAYAPPDWVLHSTVNNVDFYYKIGDCNGRRVVFLKMDNRNSQAVTVSWKESFSTQLEEKKEGFRGRKQLVIARGESYQTDCANVRIKQLMVQSSDVSPAYVAEIRKFEFKDITVVNQ